MKTYRWSGDIALLTSALDVGEWSASRPGRFTNAEGTPVTIGYEAGWAPKPVWTGR